MSHLRHALYHPPYGGASGLAIELLDADLFELLLGPEFDPLEFELYEVDWSASSYFVQEWWDYFWFFVRPSRNEVIALYGTATD